MRFPLAPWWVATQARHKALAGVAIAVTLVAGIYAVAATTATNIAGGFTTTQSESHSRNVAFEAETMRVSAERAVALEKCDLGTRRERRLCRAAARADEERAVFRRAYPRVPKP
jgi:hypothetical protein